MMNRTIRNASLAALALTLVGCQGEDPKAKTVEAPPPPPAPKKPAVESIESLMAQLNIDPRVVLPEDKAPPTTAERKAVLELFDGFVRGDSQVVSSYISYSDRPLLQELVSSGQWKESTDKISQVRIESGITPLGEPCVLAIIQSGMKFQPQMWQYSAGTDMPYMFDSFYAPPDMMNKLSGTDWISAWYKIVEDELKLAEMPDEDLAPAQRVLDETTSSGGSVPSGPVGQPGRGPARAPGGPTAPTVAPGKGPNGPSKR